MLFFILSCVLLLCAIITLGLLGSVEPTARALNGFFGTGEQGGGG